MTRPAARSEDTDMCPRHGFGEQTADEHRVRVNGKLLLHVTAKIACGGCSDFVVTGSGTVTLAGLPVARGADHTMHGGALVRGSGNVNVGGPNAGSVLGEPDAGKKACEALAATRQSGKTSQSYGNCGIESSRLIVNKVRGTDYTEGQFVGYAIQHGYTSATATEHGAKGAPEHVEVAVTRKDADGNVVVDHVEDLSVDSESGERPSTGAVGGLSPSHQSDIMNEHGVPAELMDQTMGNITQAVADGKGVITWNDAAILWEGEHVGGSGSHAVNVTGLRYDADGKLVGVRTADTGLGQCCRLVPADQFARSLYSRIGLTEKIAVTKKAVWR